MADEHDEHDDHADSDDLDPELEQMADAIESEREDERADELADALAGPNHALPKTLLLPALGLVAASAAPLHPDGYSFLQLLYVAFLRHPLEGLVMLMGFGAPFCFGVVTALGAQLEGKGPATQAILQRALVTNLSFLHAQMLLVAFLLWRDGIGMLPGALLGFSVVSGFYFIYQHAMAAAGTIGGLSTRWLIRWGATVIVALCGWIRLQLLVGVRLGWAIEIVLACCMAIAVLVSRRNADGRA